VDGLELPAPEPLHGGSECLETFEQKVALEGEMAHLVAQELFGNGLDDGIAATQGEQAEINFRDEFGGEQHLDIELKVHQIAHPAEDGVGPLLLEQSAVQMDDGSRQQGSVALLFGDEEIDGALIALQIFERSDAARVTAQTRVTPALAQLEDGDGASESGANVFGQIACGAR